MFNIFEEILWPQFIKLEGINKLPINEQVSQYNQYLYNLSISRQNWIDTQNKGAILTTPTPLLGDFLIDTSMVVEGVTTNDNQFQLPLVGVGVTNFTIDWGDGTTDIITDAAQPETLHTYATPGEYYINITSGILRGWRFGGIGDAVKLKEIYDWSKWEINTVEAFDGCSNLVSSAITIPTISAISLASTFRGCSLFNGSVNGRDVSGVTDMNNMFSGASSFNQPLNSWDVSGVTDMSYMFDSATSFNQPLDSWNVSSVTTMQSMFFAAQAFNQPLNSWNVGNVTNMQQMFNIALSFNQPLDNWDVSSVTTMQGMFFGDLMTFNQNIGGWDVSNVTNLIDFLDNALPTSFSPANLNAIYNGWSLLTVQPNVTAEFGVAKYTAAGAAGRAILDNAPNNWTITDGGQV